MTPETHERARLLGDQARVEGLSAADHEWLERHLESCVECARLAETTSRALRSLRGLPVTPPPGLASRTQLRVYLRARELERRRSRGWMVWTACAVSFTAGIASAPYVWQAFAWVGQHAGFPPLLWKVGFALWWAIPALLAAGAALMDRSGIERFRTR